MRKIFLSLSFVFWIFCSNAQTVRVDSIQAKANCRYFLMETPNQVQTVLEFQIPDYEKGEQPVIYDLKSKKALRIGKDETLIGGAGSRIVTTTLPDEKVGKSKLTIYSYQKDEVVVEKVIEREDYLFAQEVNDRYMVISNTMDANTTKLELYEFANGKSYPIELPAKEYGLIKISFNLEEGVVAFGGARKGEEKVGDVWVCDLNGKRQFSTKVSGGMSVINYLSCISRDKVLVSNFGENLLLDSKGGSTNVSDNGRKFFVDLKLSANTYFGHYSEKEVGVFNWETKQYSSVPNDANFSFGSVHVAGLTRGEYKANVLDLGNNLFYKNGEYYNLNLGGNVSYFNSVFSQKYNLLISKFQNYVYILKPIKS